jgi:hypothetical protein
MIKATITADIAGVAAAVCKRVRQPRLSQLIRLIEVAYVYLIDDSVGS